MTFSELNEIYKALKSAGYEAKRFSVSFDNPKENFTITFLIPDIKLENVYDVVDAIKHVESLAAVDYTTTKKGIRYKMFFKYWLFN